MRSSCYCRSFECIQTHTYVSTIYLYTVRNRTENSYTIIFCIMDGGPSITILRKLIGESLLKLIRPSRIVPKKKYVNL